jgi:Reverse transcriptase (RNA-dependent DNA polymerase)
MARTSLIHANRLWPDAVSVFLWPYALRYANDCINSTPFPDKEETPLELFSGTKVIPNFKDIHPFACPAYALDGRVQGGQKAPKWSARARLAVYLGPSPVHAKSVGNLLSLTTGLVSPQFHVHYDDTFQTLRNSTVMKSIWQDLAGFTSAQKHYPRASSNKSHIPNSEQLSLGINNEMQQIDTQEGLTIEEQSDDVASVNEFESEGDIQSINSFDSINEGTVDEGIEAKDPQVTRSGRISRYPRRYDDYVAFVSETEQINEINRTMSLAASSDPDILYLHEALAADDKIEFIKAMQKEVESHVNNKNWEIVQRSQIPPDRKVLPAVWAMRRKRDIATRKVTKWKARLNLHGGKQVKGVDYWETYAPVASWASIRLIMYVAILKQWETRQLDFVLAFPQAPVETDLYMDIPSGFEVSGNPKEYALKLINNLYGQKQAGRVWNIHLTKGLQDLGFKQSVSDPCIFWRRGVVLVIYTDDTIVTGADTKEVQKAIDDISSKFTITSQQKVDDFLGVKIIRHKMTGQIEFVQPHLIDSILQDIGLLDGSNSRKLPANTTKILHQYKESEGHDESAFHYRSVIGKLSYLEKCTRPDIAYAVHQCARFSANPKTEHTKAVKLIGRYLLATRDKGILCTPNDEGLLCYADAGFAGDWNADIAEEDPSTARSRSGFLITYAGCPLIWCSKLQIEIALSTTESEYISLSSALREVIPLRRLIEEMTKVGFDLPANKGKVLCTAFEDNSGAYEMARSPKMRPRTKHLNIKYHHFREEVTNGNILINQIETENQLADIFTKPLGYVLFRKFRKAIMGWDVHEDPENSEDEVTQDLRTRGSVT